MPHKHFVHRIEDNRLVIYPLRKKGQAPDPQTSPRSEGLGKLHATSHTHTQTQTTEKKEKRSCSVILKIIYLVLAFINIVKSIALIAVSVTTAIAIKIFTDEQSGRRVAMIIIAITAAITLSISIYAIVAVLTKKTQRLMIASIVLLVLAIIQAVLMGIATELTDEDEVKLSRALSDSFRLAREDSPRHVKLWNNIQHDLSCCGVYSADDYRNPNVPDFFAPDVPISCCAGYHPDRSSLVQERERESCKAKKEYFDVGCRDPIIELYRDTARTVLGVTVGLIIFMVSLSLVGMIISRKCKPIDEDPTPPPASKSKAPPKPPKV
ncbi:uncharacterized protein LOC120624785 isoform X2 [Pararge aegeria]|uniref:uncharacterized protein LOC120624785 isoform X2 n=1 Tax=Pararge aegeria TaxID=116150 RepID=UPI0019D25B3B|nr:uncharacterized protein LOC120624785 isoform X2 [Pararge aegeria]